MARSESGFTLLELLVSISIVGVLSATSIQAYSVYREQAYSSSIDVNLMNVRSALEGGKSNFDESIDGGMSVFSDATGALRGWRWGSDGGRLLEGKDLLPGYKATKDVRISASHNVWCNPGQIRAWGGDPSQLSCIVDSIMVRHCKGPTVKNWMIWNTGELMEFEWGNWGC